MDEKVRGRFGEGLKIRVPSPNFTIASDIVYRGAVFMSQDAHRLLETISTQPLLTEETPAGIFMVNGLIQNRGLWTLGALLDDCGDRAINPWVAVGLALQYAASGWPKSHEATRIIAIHDWAAPEFFLVTTEGDCEGKGSPHTALCTIKRENRIKVNTGLLLAY